jgi:hypothetical protein
VCEAIASHPEAYYQNDFVADVDKCGFPVDVAAKNTCGTAFCRAGWVVLLHDGVERARGYDVSDRAVQLIGLKNGRRSSLWAHRDIVRLFQGDAVKGQAGTRAYVREGVRGLRMFMRKHAKHLKARLLKGV